MLKERATIDYVVLILNEISKCHRATGGELAVKLQGTSCNSATYLRKVLSRMAGQFLITANGIDGYTLTKAYDQYTLSDVLAAASSEPLYESPASRAEDYLKESAKQLKLKDLV